MALGRSFVSRLVADSRRIHTVSAKSFFNREPKLARLVGLCSSSEFRVVVAGIK
jgi:hypothetical protein